MRRSTPSFGSNNPYDQTLGQNDSAIEYYDNLSQYPIFILPIRSYLAVIDTIKRNQHRQCVYKQADKNILFS